MLEGMNHLQTIIMTVPPSDYSVNFWRSSWLVAAQEKRVRTERAKKKWIRAAKRILVHIQFRDKLEKTVVLRDYSSGRSERRIVIRPKSSFELEEGAKERGKNE